MRLLPWTAAAFLACPAAVSAPVPAGSILRVDVPALVKFPRLRVGNRIDGVVSQPLYAGGRVVVPQGSRCGAVVSRVNKTDAGGSRWKRMLAGIYTVPPKTAAYTASLAEARCVLPGGQEIPLAATMVGLWEPLETQASADRPKRRKKKDVPPLTLAILRLDAAASFPEPTGDAVIPEPAVTSLPAGTRARLMLLTPLNTSKTRTGDTVRAALATPVLVDGRMALPAGAVLEGRVSKSIPSRWLQRSGSLQLTFDRLVPAAGAPSQDVPTSVVAVETERGAPVSLGVEGTVHSGPRSVKARLIQVGVSYAIGKVVDDLTEEGIKMGLGAAASGTAATAARYVGLTCSAVFLLAQHGRDVRLPEYSAIDIEFSRPVPLEIKQIVQ